MAEVSGIEMSDADAPLVEELIRRVHEVCPTSSHYRRDRWKHICFALQGRDTDHKVGRWVFFVIEVNRRGEASGRPAKRFKALAGKTRTNFESLDKLVNVAYEAYMAIQKRPGPVRYQSTETPTVLVGGRPESNRRKF
jgi:hypothetical protein